MRVDTHVKPAKIQKCRQVQNARVRAYTSLFFFCCRRAARAGQTFCGSDLQSADQSGNRPWRCTGGGGRASYPPRICWHDRVSLVLSTKNLSEHFTRAWVGVFASLYRCQEMSTLHVVPCRCTSTLSSVPTGASRASCQHAAPLSGHFPKPHTEKLFCLAKNSNLSHPLALVHTTATVLLHSQCVCRPERIVTACRG